MIDAAIAEQSSLTLTALRASTNDLSLVVGSGRGVDPKQVARAQEIAAESRSLHSQLLARKPVDSERLDMTMLQAQELALHLRVDQIRSQLQQLRSAADTAGKGVVSTVVGSFHGKFRSLDALGAAFDNHLQRVRIGNTRRAQRMKSRIQKSTGASCGSCVAAASSRAAVYAASAAAAPSMHSWS